MLDEKPELVLRLSTDKQHVLDFFEYFNFAYLPCTVEKLKGICKTIPYFHDEFADYTEILGRFIDAAPENAKFYIELELKGT